MAKQQSKINRQKINNLTCPFCGCLIKKEIPQNLNVKYIIQFAKELQKHNSKNQKNQRTGKNPIRGRQTGKVISL